MKWIALAAGVFVVAGVVAGGLLAASRSSSTETATALSSGPYRGSEPPPGIHAPDFTLRDYRGKTIRMAKLRGNVVLTTFVDSACREACPLILARLGRGLRMLDASARSRVVALAITVNPKIDTPAHVRRFLGQRGALGEVGYLIGSVKELRPIWRAYGIVPAVDTGDTDVHSADVRIFDRRGVWVSTLHTAVDLTPANLAHDIETALERG